MDAERECENVEVGVFPADLENSLELAMNCRSLGGLGSEVVSAEGSSLAIVVA